MLVKDVMTYNVVAITSDTPMLEAERILEFNNFERLPVVDKGKLVGLVTKDNILRARPSSATSLSQMELIYILSRLTVKEIMKTNLVTVTPDTAAEKAVSMAQARKVGCLPVVEDGRLVGIVTTNDFFYKIINPLFGISGNGHRMKVYDGGDGKQMQRILECINRTGLKITTLWKPSNEADRNDLIIHLETDNVEPIVRELKEMGFRVESRDFTI